MEQKSDLLRVVRQKQRETIDSALDECIDAGVMWEFLTNNRDEVAEILLDEWNWNIAIKVAAEEVREKTLCELVHNGYLTVEQAAGFAGVTKQKLLDWIRQYYGNKEKIQRGGTGASACKSVHGEGHGTSDLVHAGIQTGILAAECRGDAPGTWRCGSWATIRSCSALSASTTSQSASAARGNHRRASSLRQNPGCESAGSSSARQSWKKCPAGRVSAGCSRKSCIFSSRWHS